MASEAESASYDSSIRKHKSDGDTPECFSEELAEMIAASVRMDANSRFQQYWCDLELLWMCEPNKLYTTTYLYVFLCNKKLS